jgi:outer membrane protein
MRLYALRKINSRSLLLIALSFFCEPGWTQCAGVVSSPSAASSCAARAIPDEKITKIDPQYPYSLAELIDIGEHNNPETRVAWEKAKQRANLLGVEKSAYYPILAGIAAFGDQRAINPFPEPLAPRGYTMIELPFVQPQVTLQYLLLDFGGRAAHVNAAQAEALAAGATFIQANQDIAYTISSDFYSLVTAQERLQASTDILKTAQTTQDAAESRLSNGRATMPDVLNARAETAQAAFDLEAADGDEKIARVTLAEALGVEPSPNIAIDAKRNAPLPKALTLPIDQLIDRAMADRPDLMAKVLEVRAANDQIRAAQAAYRPKVVLSGAAAQTTGWPSTDQSQGKLGYASEPTWSASLSVEWTIFDGGARKNQKALAESQMRQAQNELRNKRDQAQREVWSSYIAFSTALRQEEAAVALLSAADTSYSASLDAYTNGVENLVDVVTAEKQLALARLSSVSARSRVFVQAVRLESVTGNLLRSLPPATTTQDKDGQK